MDNLPRGSGPANFSLGGTASSDGHLDHQHQHPHSHGGNDGHDHGGSSSHDHGDECQNGCGKVAYSPWNILPWDEVAKSFVMTEEQVELPTMTSNCRSIADWEAAILHGTLNVNEIDERGYNGFHYAVRRGNLNLVKYLVSQNADIYKHTEDPQALSPIHLAVESGDVSVLHFLVEKGLPIDSKDAHGDNPLSLAIRTGRLVQAAYLLRSKPETANLQDSEGRTALHIAILFGSYNIMRELLQHKPNVNIYDNAGFLPVHYAAKTANPHALLALAEYDFLQFSKLTKQGDRLLTLASETGDEVCVQVIRQYSSLTHFPHWFKVYMWSLSSAGWVILFLFATYFFNFWVVMLMTAFAVRLLYTLSQTELWKNSRNPIMATGAQMFGLLAMTSYFFWVFPHSVTESSLLAFCIIPCYALCLEFSRRTWARDPGFRIYSASDIVQFASIAKNEKNAQSLCESCLANRPMRTKHCSKCDRCVDVAQHHCPLLNICIGKNNHQSFIVVLVACILTCSIWLYFTLPALSSIAQLTGLASPFTKFRALMDSNGALTLISIGVIGLLAYCSFFLALHISLIVRNLTAYERANWQRYNYMLDQDGEYYNPSDKGIAANISEFLKASPREETYKNV